MTQFLQFFSEYWAARERASANGCDFAFGNPHDMPLPGIEAALQKHAVAQNKDWFAYKMSEAASQRHVADALRDRLGIPFEPEDVAMTNGAFGALQVALAALLDEGDEVIINLPPWFFYEALIAASRGVTVKVKVKPQDFDLDLDAISRRDHAKNPGRHREFAQQPHRQDLYSGHAAGAGRHPD